MTKNEQIIHNTIPLNASRKRFILEEVLEINEKYKRNYFVWLYDKLGVKPAECIDALRGKQFRVKDARGIEKTVMLFDYKGRIAYNDLAFYKKKYFKNQTREYYREENGKRLTWQQTLIAYAYQRGLRTFDGAEFPEPWRWISVLSGHGIGKSASLSLIALHFLSTFTNAQIGVTSSGEQQVYDIFMKELSTWHSRLPQMDKDSITITSDHARVNGSEKEWFLRAQVAREDKPEALAGLHGKYVLLILDEASGVPNKTIETMSGATSGDNYLVIYTSNGTRTEGFFYDSHNSGKYNHTALQFNCEESPIVSLSFVERIKTMFPDINGKPSDEYRIRVQGQFARTTGMDDKGWIPLFANVHIRFVEPSEEILMTPIIALDPAGKGKDLATCFARDSVYLKEMWVEETSTPMDLARKTEATVDVFGTYWGDVIVEAFGIGAEVVANMRHPLDAQPIALLTDKPRENEDRFVSYKAELAWRFMEWCSKGGIIVTRNVPLWREQLSHIKFKRTQQGKIQLMPKETFKKLYGYSPDRFDGAIHTFHLDRPSRKTQYTPSRKDPEAHLFAQDEQNRQANRSSV